MIKIPHVYIENDWEENGVECFVNHALSKEWSEDDIQREIMYIGFYTGDWATDATKERILKKFREEKRKQEEESE